MLNAETARLKLEEVVERKRAMLEERFERLNHARENEERRQAEKRAEWMEKERKREEATREAKRAAAENWQKRKVEHQTQIEAHKQAWYNKLTTTEKEVQSRMSEKFSRTRSASSSSSLCWYECGPVASASSSRALRVAAVSTRVVESAVRPRVAGKRCFDPVDGGGLRGPSSARMMLACSTAVR